MMLSFKCMTHLKEMHACMNDLVIGMYMCKRFLSFLVANYWDSLVTMVFCDVRPSACPSHLLYPWNHVRGKSTGKISIMSENRCSKVVRLLL